MRAVPVAEFKLDVAELVEAAGGGEEIVIMRDGQPLARLVPPESDEELRERQLRVLTRMVEHREELRAQGVHITSAEIREWIDEGRP